MKMITLSRSTFAGLVVGGIASVVVLVPLVSQAATCTFTRDLKLGVTGEDVKCLQVYLNENGFTIAETGAGSPGNETGEYKALTEAAVKKWQTAKGIAPASGTFGPLSRAFYRTGDTTPSGEVLGVTTKPAGSLATPELLQALLKRLVSLEARVALLEGKKPATTNPSAATPPKPVSGSLADRAEAALNEADDAFVKAEDEIAEADDDGERVDLAEELLDEVAGMLSQAEDLFDDKDYARVLTLTKRALPLIAEAVDAIGKRDDSDEDDEDSEDLEDRLDALRDDLEDLKDEVDEAIDDGDDVGEAEDLLDEAEDLLDDAEDALDDGDEDEAEDLLDEAEDLLEDAEDEL